MKRANTPPRPEPRRDERDPHASPLGRGSNPGKAVDPGPLEATGIAGPHGVNTPNETGGASGLETRENEDARPLARRDVDDAPR